MDSRKLRILDFGGYSQAASRSNVRSTANGDNNIKNLGAAFADPRQTYAGGVYELGILHERSGKPMRSLSVEITSSISLQSKAF